MLAAAVLALGSCGDDGGNGMADEDDVIGRQYSVIRNTQAGNRAGAGAWHRADFGGDIFACIDGNHAGRMRRFRRVYAGDPRMRIHRAQKRDRQRIRELDIVNVVAESLNQSRVFSPLDALADEFICHKSSSGQGSVISGQLCAAGGQWSLETSY